MTHTFKHHFRKFSLIYLFLLPFFFQWIITVSLIILLIPSNNSFLFDTLYAISLTSMLIATSTYYGIKKHLIQPLLTISTAIKTVSQNPEALPKFDEYCDEIKQIGNSLPMLAEKFQYFLHLLRENESRLSQFLEAVPVGVIITDDKGRPYYINECAQKILGKGIMPIQDAKHLIEVYQVYLSESDQLYPEDELPIIKALAGENSTLDNMEIRRKDKVIPLEVWGSPIFNENHEVVYAMAIFRDITERKKAEANHKKFTQELYQINWAYGRFVPREFLSLLDKSSVVDVYLGDHIEKEMTVMFSDIRGFTGISEKMTPQDNFEFINAYLGEMEPVISEYHGLIDKYIGDAIMALFPTNADDALHGSIAMLRKLEKHNEVLVTVGFEPIQIGIGLNTGPLMLGTVGGKNRMDGTVISDAVNLAARVEGLTKVYGTALLITEQTYDKLVDPEKYKIRVIDSVRVKGKTEPVTVYEVFDADTTEMVELKLRTRQDFEYGFAYYHHDHFNTARKLFEKVLSINEHDEVARIYLKRCQNAK